MYHQGMCLANKIAKMEKQKESKHCIMSLIHIIKYISLVSIFIFYWIKLNIDEFLLQLNNMFHIEFYQCVPNWMSLPNNIWLIRH